MYWPFLAGLAFVRKLHNGTICVWAFENFIRYFICQVKLGKKEGRRQRWHGPGLGAQFILWSIFSLTTPFLLFLVSPINPISSSSTTFAPSLRIDPTWLLVSANALLLRGASDVIQLLHLLLFRNFRNEMRTNKHILIYTYTYVLYMENMCSHARCHLRTMQYFDVAELIIIIIIVFYFLYTAKIIFS